MSLINVKTMSWREIVEQILLQRPDQKKEEIMEKIEKKRAEANGLLTYDAAAKLVALELGIKIRNQNSAFPSKILVKNLVPGLNDVTITGRVITVYPTKIFTQADGSKTAMAKLLVADKTGILTVVFWNAKEDMLKRLEQVKPGKIIRVSHGYVREGLDGRLELNLGSRSQLEILPQEAGETDFPDVNDFLNRIGELTAKHRRANVLGRVEKISSPSTFQRRNGTTGKVLRLQLKDETGQVTLVAWNEKVEELSNVEKNDVLRVMNAKVKKRFDGQLELHVENDASIERIQEDKMLIKDLKENAGPVTVEGTVAATPIFREVTLKTGEKVGVTTFQLADTTGKVSVSAWRKLAEEAKKLKTGMKVKVKNVFVKKGFADQLEITTRNVSAIEILSET